MGLLHSVMPDYWLFHWFLRFKQWRQSANVCGSHMFAFQGFGLSFICQGICSLETRRAEWSQHRRIFQWQRPEWGGLCLLTPQWYSTNMDQTWPDFFSWPMLVRHSIAYEFMSVFGICECLSFPKSTYGLIRMSQCGVSWPVQHARPWSHFWASALRVLHEFMRCNAM